ncbi:MAG TPA: hypothetical protein VHD33_05755, partial [Legionellaceae bacterium]|nr:hypothetical protein [Legionellaceae bacterium]
MVCSPQDHHIPDIYPDFLNRLDIIGNQIVALNIDVPSGLSLQDIKKNNNPVVRIAWSLYRIHVLLKESIQGQVVHRNSWFKKERFYLRLYQRRAELEACLHLMTGSSTDQYYFLILTDEHFQLGCIFWDLLQALNPKHCSDADDFWEMMYHNSQAWRRAFEYGPAHLYRNLCLYYHSKEPNERQCLYHQIGSSSFVRCINDETFQVVNAKVRQINIFTQLKPYLPTIAQDDFKKNLDDRLAILAFLKGQLIHRSNNTDMARFTKAIQEYDWQKVISAFQSPIETPNQYSEVSFIDKLCFIIDVIFLSPS